ncbi:MAG: histidine phosphatase family protein [Bacilli bacterium]
MKLYVVRHGQTTKNLLNIVHGQTESSLTEYGIQKAYELRKTIDQKKIDMVISSPLSRAKQTAKILIEDKLPINIDDRLIERNWGLCEGALINTVDRVKCFNYYLNYQDNEIEPLNKFMQRIVDFINEIKRKYPNKTILIVTHGAVSRIIYYYLNGIPQDGNLARINIPNLKLIEYNLD